DLKLIIPGIERLERRKSQEEASIKELEQDIANTESLVEVAAEQMKLADAEVSRLEGLGTNFSSASELDQARQSRLTTMNQKVTLQNQLSAFRARQTRTELAAKLVETEIEQAKLSLARTEVRAPVEGRVVQDQVEVDSFVQRGAQLLTIEDTEKVEVSCNIRMDQLSWILEQPNLSTDRIVNAAQATRYELPETPVEVKFAIAGRESVTYVWEGVLDRFEGAGLDTQSRTVPIRIRVDKPNQARSADGDPIEVGGPPMLVRGMFVDVDIKARPTTPLLLVPKLGVKPATESSVIWKFQSDDAAVDDTEEAQEARIAYDEAKAAGTLDEVFGPKEGEEGVATEGKTLDPSDWQAGRLVIVDNVRMVSSYGNIDGVEYWICEVNDDSVDPEDLVIVSPLPGVKADGTDPVKIRKANAEASPEEPSQASPEATVDASTSESNGI
ncbi:MAG: HlyD family efflux transporter periplasmic adaptor subunit, partial [Planctomycetota bacterium]